ncbi:glutarate dioxygenase GlaH [Paenibacillus radicis (ex Xue et al. 2023)]|uniref:Glutarate dioxygenase GlaH n=1 Tax=Paenibacillus radicis (ex Xue et al. 2023) TaxID=2972489 RepID=A0ABT1YHP5_9BACL|nr:glutarate dioxygenase GlaH [Paenibacillus radicis (ex Xue et al. 2023)]MCR8632711.1 glutarate dioxygenase GlaH [Paenibacillus radicis (ex Xue et al. 2023)]
MSFVQTQAGYKVTPHPQHNRLYHIVLDNSVIEKFLQEFSGTGIQHLEYTPYMRFILAGKLRDLLGTGFLETLRNILADRQSGGFTIGVQGQTTSLDDYVKFGTAVSHLIGPSNFDAMSGTYYARFVVKDTDNSDSYLRQAYRLFTLHTDGTFVDEPTDWLLMMKMEERNAVGGESRLLHLDDWEELEQYATHSLADHKFTYKSPSSKNVGQVVHRPTFFKVNNKPCICFIDQFVYPATIEQSHYLMAMSESLERSPATNALKLPEGDLIMLNNMFWMHGRAAFEKNTELYRELMRIRGEFAKS